MDLPRVICLQENGITLWWSYMQFGQKYSERSFVSTFQAERKKQEEKDFEGMHSDVLANIYGNRKCQSILRFFFLMDKPVDSTNDGNWSLMHILTKWLTQKKKKKDYKCLQFTSFSLDSLMDYRFSQRNI